MNIIFKPYNMEAYIANPSYSVAHYSRKNAADERLVLQE